MRRLKKCICIITAFMMIFALFPQKLQAKTEMIHIKSIEDFNEFVQLSRLDTWSRNKSVYLDCDLDFTEQEFTSVPIFSGMFDGQGHTITGIQIDANEPIKGLFRIIEAEGIVQNLNVSSAIAADEGRQIFGGIAGENYGRIINCKFYGKIYGDAIIGGIAGINQDSGRIANCEVSGTLGGEKYTGGISGENFGSIIKCVNRCRINTSAKENTLDLENLDLNQLESFNNMKPINTHTDTGGISGYSSGIIQSCINYAMIGYPHMGYNIGGIVGRQSGYLSGCSNYGHIFGRKDVGGIVGQMEPAFIQQISRNQLQSLGDELDQLQRMIDNAMNHADASSSAISIEINTLANYADAAADSSKRVLDQSADYIDSTIETINDTSTLIIEALDRLDPIIKKLKITSDSFTQTCSQLEKAIKELQIISDDSGAVIHQVNLALDDLKKANQALASAADKLDKALQLLSDAAASGDQEKINEALNQLNEGMRELSDAAHQGSEAMKRFADAMKGSGNASDALEELSLSLSAMSGAITKTNDALKTLIDEIDWTKVSEALKEASDALADVQKASTDFNEGLKKLGSALDELEALNDDLAPLYTQLRKTTRALASTSDDFSDMVREIRKQVKALADKEPIQFTRLPSGYQQDSNQLHASISGISASLKSLNQEVERSSKTLTADIRAISDQFNVIMHLMIEALSQPDTVSDVFEDTSDQDIDATTNGKVADSVNYDIVEGDVNIGGIAGSMAIEFDLDPEDDLSSASDKLNYRYETKAVMSGCINKGSVIAKKNNVGGLVGRLDLGTVSQCEGYGMVESTSGDYVGGIAGYADAKIQQCIAKAELKGNNYIGGIAGMASTLIDSYALIKVSEGIGRIGAIAGATNKYSQISGNYFVDTGFAGIDGISYAGIAQPIDYQALKELNTLPSAFFDFTLTFKADNQTIKTIPFDFNEDLSSLTLPAIPEKAGYYASWPAFDYHRMQFSEVLRAQYQPMISVLASDVCIDEKPLVLAQGAFTDQDLLTVSQFKDDNCWQVQLTAKQSENITLRLLKHVDGKVSLWVLNDAGAWVSKPFTDCGSYLQIDMEESELIFCITPKKSYTLLLAGGLTLILIILFIIKKRYSHSQ